MLALVAKTPSDAEFLKIFNRLCVALRESQDDSGVTQGVYFEALRDLSLPALEAGAQSLMKEPGRRFFPTTAEWRAEAERAQMQQLKQAVQPAREQPWRFDCTACEDTGWERFECTGDTSCGRQRRHEAHTYVRVCPCRATNRTWQRHQNFGSGA